MTPAELYGPWDVAGYQVEIDVTQGVRLAVSRNGNRLKAVPGALRECGDFAWIRLALEAATSHQRELKRLLENSMTEAIPLSGDDLAMLALDPVGRGMFGGLLVEAAGLTGRAVPEDWALETLRGDLVPLRAPAVVAHPARLEARGTLRDWDRWLSRRWVRQPFKQIRRELYVPNADDLRCRTFSDRFAGECVRWDQTRALLEGRGWYRVTKTGAERTFPRARLTAHVEFRTPASRGFSTEQVVLGRVYILPRGEQSQSRANPGTPLDRVPVVLFSETLRDVALVAQVARR